MNPPTVPVAPSLTLSPEAARLSRPARPLDQRALMMSGLAVLIGGIAGLVAEGLTLLIWFVTNLSFYGRVSIDHLSPADNHLGLWVVIPPVIGGVIVGLMAKYGSKAIRGHGIPEAMEQIVLNKSRIPARVALLKPLSAAIAIGTGGPFGAEGPIIATGGAFGSLIGQSIAITAIERRTLLAAGAAAGMAATFGAPVAAVLLALEFLLYELRARSIIPVALASTVATAVRWSFHGSAPVFAMPNLAQPDGVAIVGYIALGAFSGFLAIGVTQMLYGIEDAFEELPIHWMWWPALGAVVVGVVGWISPHTLGVGYDNITNILSGNLTWQVMAALAFWKFISWVISLASGTSGGTLAPMFTIGGAVGAVVGTAAAHFFPSAGFDPRIAALVGMASMFAGASHTLLTWVVFAFETTRQPLGLLPILGGAAAAYLVAGLGMRDSIMTQKISRRGVPLVMGPEVDFLRIQTVKQWATTPVMTLAADMTIGAARTSLAKAKHQGFPVVDADQQMVGMITRREIEEPDLDENAAVRSLLTRTPVVTFDDVSLREAADIMVDQGVGRLPVVTRDAPTKVAGIITRSDLLRAHQPRLEDAYHLEPSRLRRKTDPPTTAKAGGTRG